MKNSLFDPLSWFWPISTDKRVLDVEERRRHREALRAQKPLASSDVTEFLFSAIMSTIDAKHDMIRTLETKAASQVGFAGAILAILVTLGRSNDATALFKIAIIALALCIISNLRAMFVSEYDAPSPLIYNLASTLDEPDNKAKIAISLTEAYGQYGLDLGVEAGRKSRYVVGGTVLLAVGIAFVLASAFSSTPTRELNIQCPNRGCEITIVQGTSQYASRPKGSNSSTNTPIRSGNGGRRQHSSADAALRTP